MFSHDGIIAHAGLNPTHGIFPNPLALWDSPTAVTITLSLAVLAALLFALGIARTWMALLLWFLSTALFHRNNLTSNPSIPYLGLILLLTTLVPTGEPLSVSRRKEPWGMPRWILPTATIPPRPRLHLQRLDEALLTQLDRRQRPDPCPSEPPSRDPEDSGTSS